LRWTILPLLALIGCSTAPHQPGERALELICVRVDAPPVLDGSAGDDAWSKATPLTVASKDVLNRHGGAEVKVTLRAVRSATQLYLLAQWEDATKDDAEHKPWVWDKMTNLYAEGPEREDMFAVGFEHRGEFTADMLAPIEGSWDVWQWKVTRTNPQGYAMDRLHVYSRSQPPGKAKEHKARDGKPLWISRAEDAGKTVEGKVPAPKEFRGDRVSQYVNSIPEGSAADVRAKGSWSNGEWTLELGRALRTGHDDDTPFDTAKSYRMAISTHDRTGDMDRASGVILLGFGK